MKLKTKLFIFLSFLFLVFISAIWSYSKIKSDEINEKWGEKFVKKQIIFDKNRTLLPIIREMERVKKMATERSIIDMALNEEDENIHTLGVQTLEKYQQMFEDRSYFTAFTKTGHYYFNDKFYHYNPQKWNYTLSPSKPNDSWFYTTITSVDAIGVNIDKDESLGVTKVWLNCLLKDNGKIIGVVGTGFDFTQFVNESVGIDQEGVNNYFIDKRLAIQLAKDTKVIDYASITKKDGQHKTLDSLFENRSDIDSIKNAMERVSVSNVPDSVETLWVVYKGTRQLLGVSYLREIGWYNLTLIDPKELVIVDNHNIFIVLGALFLVALMILNAVINHVVIKPLNLLQEMMNKIEKGEYNVNIPIIGSGEIADLSGQFNRMIEYVQLNNRDLEEKVKERTVGLMESEMKFHALFDTTTDAVMLLDENGFFECNQAALDMFECQSVEEFCTFNPAEISPATQPCGGDSRTLAMQHIETALKTGYDNFDWVHKRMKSGKSFFGEVTLNVVKLGNKNVLQSVVHDISERKRIEEEIRELAFYDALTQLPNRRLLNDRLDQALVLCKRSELYGAVMFLDLDNFKPLNDLFGHDIGDLLLIEAAQRLSGCIREVDTVARFGGDEFVVLLSRLSQDEDESMAYAESIAEKIGKKLAEKYVLQIDDDALGTIEHHCTMSIGVTLFSKNDVSREKILQSADKAMYDAKEAGRNQIKFI
jgi:diguanylate cyclase (GGDEF)-like protein/PAS domain S-box-containing protein